MAIKLTLEIKQDPEIGGPPDAMQQMFDRLVEVAGLPTGGFRIVFLAADEAGVDRIREQVEAAFEDRPYCIVATLDRKDDKADLRRRRLTPGPTPIDREIDRRLRAANQDSSEY